MPNELQHYGIPGMKWGKRKDKTGSSSSKTSEVSDDAKRANDARTKAKTKGVQSLSNKELQDVVTRDNLMRQYNQLTPAKKSTGQKVYDGLKTTVKYANEAYGMYNSPAGRMLRETLKAAR